MTNGYSNENSMKTSKRYRKYVAMRGHGEAIFSPGDLGARLRARCGEENNTTRKLLFGVQHVGKKSKSNGLFK